MTVAAGQFCVPVKEEVSLRIGAATQRLTDDVAVPELRRTSGKTHTHTERERKR